MTTTVRPSSKLVRITRNFRSKVYIKSRRAKKQFFGQQAGRILSTSGVQELSRSWCKLSAENISSSRLAAPGECGGRVSEDAVELTWINQQPINANQRYIQRQSINLFLVFTHVIRRPCWCTKQRQNVAQVLHDNRIEFPKDFFRYCSVHQHARRDLTWKPRICPSVPPAFTASGERQVLISATGWVIWHVSRCRSRKI